GPVTELRELLRGISAITSPPGTELAAVPPEELLAAGVTPWSDPKCLPLWAPESHWGLPSHDPAPAAAAGLRVRPVEDTIPADLDGVAQCSVGFRSAGNTALAEVQNRLVTADAEAFPATSNPVGRLKYVDVIHLGHSCLLV